MDDEAKQLLREIRDVLVSQQSSWKWVLRATSFIVVVLLCLIAFLAIRTVRMINEIEQAPPAAAAPR